MPTLKAIKRQLVPPHDDVVFATTTVVVVVLALQLLNPKRQPEKGRMLPIMKCGIRRSVAHVRAAVHFHQS
jgi:hypothetical protein